MLTPYYGEEALTAANVVVRADPDDLKRIAELVARTSEIAWVNDGAQFAEAKRAAAELKAKDNDIRDSKRAVKRPFEAILAAIEDLAKETLAPVDKEQRRILDLLNGYVSKLEAQARAAERARQEQRRAEHEAHNQRIRALAEAKALAERQAKQATNHADSEQAKNEIARNNLAIAHAELERALELEIADMETEPPKGIVPGGRVDHPFEFTLFNAEQTVKAGCIRLLRIELDILACKDSCRAQLEIEPDKLPQLPGITVTQKTSVSVKAAARIK